MKTFNFPAAASAAALLFTAFAAIPANARCVPKPSQVRAISSAAAAQAPAFAMKLPTLAPRDLDPNAEPSMVGFWYVRFLAGGQLIDDGFDIWLSDGMEILNDSPAPMSGNVCLGTWTKTAPYTYTLKHPSWIYDDAGVNLIGVAVITEQVIIGAIGDTFTGTSALDVYDLSGNPLEHLTATMTGQRIQAVDTPPTVGGIPGLPGSILNR